MQLILLQTTSIDLEHQRLKQTEKGEKKDTPCNEFCNALFFTSPVRVNSRSELHLPDKLDNFLLNSLRRPRFCSDLCTHILFFQCNNAAEDGAIDLL